MAAIAVDSGEVASTSPSARPCGYAIQQTAAYPPTADHDAAVAAWSSEATQSGTTLAEASSYLATSSEATTSGGVLKDYIDVHQPIMNWSDVHQSPVSELDVHPPVLSGSFEHLALIHFDTTSVPDDRVSAEVRSTSGELVNSNVLDHRTLCM
jgi:hypothetical protein